MGLSHKKRNQWEPRLQGGKGGTAEKKRAREEK